MCEKAMVSTITKSWKLFINPHTRCLSMTELPDSMGDIVSQRVNYIFGICKDQ